MSRLDIELHHLLGLVYEAARDENSWQVAVGMLLRHIGSDFALINEFAIGHPALELPSVVGVPLKDMGVVIEEYAAEMQPLDPTLRVLQHEVPGVDFHLARDGITGVDARYHSWNRDRLGSEDWVATFSPRRDGYQFGASFHFRQPASAEQASLARICFAHLERARRLALDLPDIHARVDASFILGTDHRLADANAHARRLFAEADAIAERDGSVRPAAKHVQLAWAQLLEQYSGSDQQGGTGMLLLPRLDGRPPVLARVAALSPPLGRTGRRTLVTLVDMSRDTHGQQLGWCRVLGLTGAEARLAATILEPECRNLRDASDALRISYATARTQMNAIMAKTGCHSQTQLVRLLITAGRALNG